MLRARPVHSTDVGSVRFVIQGAYIRGTLRAYRTSLLEDHSAVAVCQHPVFEVPPHSAGEHPAFDFASEAHQVVYRVAVRDVGDILADYGTGVQFLRNV